MDIEAKDAYALVMLKLDYTHLQVAEVLDTEVSISMLKSVREITDPCGTPTLLDVLDPNVIFTRTLLYLSSKKKFIKNNNSNQMTASFSSFTCKSTKNKSRCRST